MSEREYRVRERELADAVEAEMDGHWQSYYRAHGICNREYDKWERYCREQRELLRALEDLKAGERQMYELDDRKDQVMTVLKLALANLAMWVRDNYFPTAHEYSTWKTLAPFFRLPGWVAPGPDTMSIELRGFNDRQLNRDLAEVFTLVTEGEPRLPDGRRLLLTPAGVLSPVARPLKRRLA